jgi:glycolate oxidase iron-sulfur subunit
MQTSFTLAQLADADTARSEQILRKCVHCGFCTATCPTFVLLGDERDSPRGRIYLIKAMLEGGRAPSLQEVRHVDRCLSCLSCMTTCPSGVHYMHLVDHGRGYIEDRYRRSPSDRFLRAVLAFLMPRPAVLRWVTILGRLVKPAAALLPAASSDPGGATFLRRVRAMLDAIPDRLAGPSPVDRPQTFAAVGPRRRRVALMPGCGQQVLAPEVNEATVRLLTRHGVEVVNVVGSGCCGSSVLHLGRHTEALDLARRNVAAWLKEIDGAGLDAIVINASGCGTTVKDYGHMLADDPAWRGEADRVARLARDVSEVMLEVGLANVTPRTLTVAYHAACSLQHGQKVIEPPKRLLRDAGFVVKDVPEGHLCCGWAGTYQVLQPELSRRLRDRKVANMESVRPDVIAAGNFGCVGNIASATKVPIVHTVELLDWATGGPKPAALE